MPVQSSPPRISRHSPEMSLAAAIKSNSLDPRRFIGRPGGRCRKCGGVFHYVNRCGGVQCEACAPPAAGDSLVRLAVMDGVWADPESPTFRAAGAPDGRKAGAALVNQPQRRGKGRDYVSERIRWIAAPLGPADFAAALAWASGEPASSGAWNMIDGLDLGDVLSGVLDDATATGNVDRRLEQLVDIDVPIAIEDLTGRLVQLSRTVPCFGGTWPVGTRFVVSGWAGGPRWNLAYNGTHRGICACERERFQLVELNLSDWLSLDL